MSKARPYVIESHPAPGNRREHKKARTRDELVRAAIQLFSEQGFEGTTVEDIAEAAGVSPRTFFRYFATKEEVVFHRKDEDISDLQSTLAARPPDEPPLPALRATVVAYLERFQADRDFHMLRVKLIRESWTVGAYGLQLHERWMRVLAVQLARRMGVDPTADLRPVLYAGCSLLAMRAALVPWVRSKGTADLRQLAMLAFDEIENGFRP